MRLSFLASHGGSNMQAIIDSIKSGFVKAEAVAVISNNSGSKALQRAINEGIAHYHISSKTHESEIDQDKAILEILKQHKTDLVILAGYMKKIGDLTLNAYHGKILNIHPALLPKFGGQGMYGKRVHEAVLKSGEKESGVTVHVVDDQYDHGPILAQKKVPVLDDDTADTLADRVLKEEHQLYAATIANIISGEISLPKI